MSARRAMIAASLAALATLALLSAAAGTALAQIRPASEAAAHSEPSTGTGYDLDFTLPTAAKAGCAVCHADSGLVRLQDGQLVSFYVDPAFIAESAHVGVQCSGCHAGFASTTPHDDDASRDWRLEAKAVCKNCHKEQFIAFGQGVHRAEVAPGQTTPTNGDTKPLCGDCHGDHRIPALTDNPKGQREIQRRGWETCGRCHEDYWDSYDDYYHGAAFKKGALDAPACWDCHGWHDIKPSSDRDSLVGVRHIAETCGQCHPETNEEFLGYAEFIHRKEDVQERVFLYELLERVQGFFAGLLGG